MHIALGVQRGFLLIGQLLPGQECIARHTVGQIQKRAHGFRVKLGKGRAAQGVGQAQPVEQQEIDQIAGHQSIGQS